jgi:membrane-associated phospholipid phosphatase
MHRAEALVLSRTRRMLDGTPAVPLARALSFFGEHAAGWLLLSALGWASGRRRREWAAGGTGVLLAHGAAVGLKRVVRRVRPMLEDAAPLVPTPSRLSFPSAHSTSTAAAAVGFAPMLGAPVMATVTGALLVSRVLLGVHYPSDVVSGAALGATVATVVRRRMTSPPSRKARS